MYSILSAEDTNELMNATIEDIEKKLISFLHIDDPTLNLKDGILLDYYVEAIIWAKEQEFTSAKFSGFFTVLHEMIENIKEKHFTIQENIHHFRKYYSGIGLPNLQETEHIDCFNINESKKIITYFCTTLFQHYALYKYVFTYPQTEEFIGTQLKIATTNAIEGFFAPPLIEAVSESILEKYKDILPNSEEQKTIQPEDAFALSSESLELLRQLTNEDLQTVFENTLAGILPQLQPEVAAALQEKEQDILSRITHLCKIDEELRS